MTKPAPETLESERDKLFVTDAELIRLFGVPEKIGRRAIQELKKFHPRPRKNHWAAYWIPRQDIAARGYPIESRLLWPPSNRPTAIPTEADWEDLACACDLLQNENGPESPIKAIRAKCMDCSGENAAEVRKCVAVRCALWPFRMGKNPFWGKSEAEAA